MSLQGATAIVTGSAGGLGREIANTLLARGAHVVICDVSETRVEAAKVEYGDSHPGKALVVKVDVTDEESVRLLFAKAVATFGKVDIVVNNAGIMDRFDPVGSCDKKTWDAVLAVNLTGPFLVTRQAVQREQDKTLIINIGSNASFKGLAGGVAYSASKHGLMAITKNTAGTYAEKGIYCIAVILGGLENTNIVDAFTTGINMDGMDKMRATQPGERLLPPDRAARYIAFLCEEGNAECANGSCITLNANWPEA